MTKRVRFNADDDLALLRQALNQNVLQDPEQWDELRENMQILTKKDFSVRSLRDHLKYLIEMWKKKDAVNRVRSGVEEILSERDNLLQDICDISRTVIATPKKLKKKTKTRDEKRSSEIGVALRDLTAKYYTNPDSEENTNDVEIISIDHSIDHEEAVSAIISDHNYNNVASTSQEVATGQTRDDGTASNQNQILVPKRKRKNQSAGLRKSGLSFIQERSEREHNIRVQELQLQEEKLQLEKRKVELQERQIIIEEKKTEQQLEIERKRFQQEISDHDSLRETISAQRELIKTLLEQLKRH